MKLLVVPPLPVKSMPHPGPQPTMKGVHGLPRKGLVPIGVGAEINERVPDS
jgi:hypothetical protein